MNRIDKFLPPRTCLHLSPRNTSGGKWEALYEDLPNLVDIFSPPTVTEGDSQLLVAESHCIPLLPLHHLDEVFSLEEYSVKCLSPYFSRQQFTTAFRVVNACIIASERSGVECARARVYRRTLRNYSYVRV